MKGILLALLLFISEGAIAQQYRKFLFAIDIGAPHSKLQPIGCFSMEPGYRISDRILVGFRIEEAGIISFIGRHNNMPLGSIGINGQYYFFNGLTRLFCGAGIGLYNPSNNFIMSNTNNLSQRNGLGAYPRIGLEFEHARVMLEYNFIQKMNSYFYSDPPGPGYYERIDQSYIAFKVGFFIGGGKKKIR